METIGLIAAMSQESNALLRRIKQWKWVKFGPYRGARFELKDRVCMVITTGMGRERAMQGTRALLGAASPSLLVSFGIAGAVEDDLQIGDVVVASQTCLLDQGQLGPPLPLASLSKAAWDASTRALQPDGARLVSGTAITTRGSQLVSQSQPKMTHPVLEMETVGIAQVAAEKEIPLVSIRSISDGPQAPIPFDLETIFDEEQNLRIGSVIKMVLRNPKIIIQSRQMMMNSGQAADHAARALVAALSQPSTIIMQ